MVDIGARMLIRATFESEPLMSQIHQFDSSWSDARRHTYVTHAHREYLIQKVLALRLRRALLVMY
jgi:hypothetical protein